VSVTTISCWCGPQRVPVATVVVSPPWALVVCPTCLRVVRQMPSTRDMGDLLLAGAPLWAYAGGAVIARRVFAAHHGGALVQGAEAHLQAQS
jgi:hypothetical protein